MLQKQRFTAVAKLTILRHKQQYPKVCKLLEVSLCIPVSSVQREHGFFFQNSIKTKARVILSEESSSMLMKLGFGPNLTALIIPKQFLTARRKSINILLVHTILLSWGSRYSRNINVTANEDDDVKEWWHMVRSDIGCSHNHTLLTSFSNYFHMF